MEPIPEMQVNITIADGESFNRNISEDLRVDDATLDESLMYQASLYAYYSSLYWRAQRIANLKQLELDELKSELWEQARQTLAQEGSSRWSVSKDRIERLIDTNPKIKALKRICIEAEANARRLYGLMKALEHKKDMIQNICYNKRKEMDFIGSSRVNAPRRESVPISGNE